MPSDEWEHVGRELLFLELAERRQGVSDAFHNAESALAVLEGENYTGDLKAADVRALRRELNYARQVVENYAARVTEGVEPWGEPVPDIPAPAHVTPSATSRSRDDNGGRDR